MPVNADAQYNTKVAQRIAKTMQNTISAILTKLVRKQVIEESV